MNSGVDCFKVLSITEMEADTNTETILIKVLLLVNSLVGYFPLNHTFVISLGYWSDKF